jgi:HSP20 family molecular chaperone IbpA
MIGFRRGRPTGLSVLSTEVDVTLDFRPAVAVRWDTHIAPWRPPIEVFETDGELVVRAELGGLSRTEVEVLVSGHELVIRGERRVASPSESRRYHESRVRYGSFEAKVPLPFPIDVELAKADYIDGFLSVMLPRRPPTKVTTRENGRVV